MSTLTLAQASSIIDTALAHARKQGFQPLCVVVLDAGGHPLALQREDRASFGRPKIAAAKAAGCLALGFGGREIAKRALAAPAFYGALGAVLPEGLLPVPGGVLIQDGGTLLGAVGISGDTSDNDEACAVAGIEAGAEAVMMALKAPQ